MEYFTNKSAMRKNRRYFSCDKSPVTNHHSFLASVNKYILTISPLNNHYRLQHDCFPGLDPLFLNTAPGGIPPPALVASPRSESCWVAPEIQWLATHGSAGATHGPWLSMASSDPWIRDFGMVNQYPPHKQSVAKESYGA